MRRYNADKNTSQLIAYGFSGADVFLGHQEGHIDLRCENFDSFRLVYPSGHIFLKTGLHHPLDK